MIHVLVIQERFRELVDEKKGKEGRSAASIFAEITDKIGFKDVNNVNGWYYRGNRISPEYVSSLAEYFNVDELYLLGKYKKETGELLQTLQDEPRRGETDASEYMGISSYYVAWVRGLPSSVKKVLDIMIQYPDFFENILDTICECYSLPQKIEENERELSSISPKMQIKAVEPSNIPNYKIATKTEVGMLTKDKLQELKGLFAQQRPLRMDLYTQVITLVDAIAPRQEEPAELIESAEETVKKSLTVPHLMQKEDWDLLNRIYEEYPELAPKDKS